MPLRSVLSVPSVVQTPSLYLLRHGETEWNLVGRKQGRADSPLTPRGLSQAHGYAAFLSARVDPARLRLVTSTLGRARRTAEIIARHLALPASAFHEAPLLAEHDFGQWEGRTSDEIEARFPGEQARRKREGWTYVIPGGESYAHVHARVVAWASHQPVDVPLIVVTHEMLSRVLQGFLTRLPPVQTLALSHPHGRIFHFESSQVTTFDTTPAPA